jgi:hypothetical protein
VKRQVELEVDARGEVTWPEGMLELAPNVAEAIAALPAKTLVRLEGTYERPSAAVKILTVTRKPLAITRPLERATQVRRDELAQFRDVIARDAGVTARVLAAELAVHEARLDDARTHVREALALGIPDAITERLARVWPAVAPVELAPELQDALLTTVWTWPVVWRGWSDPITEAAHLFVASRDRVVPRNVGGPRVEPDRRLVAAWLLDQIERIATPVDGIGPRELRAMTDAERRAWRAASEARDEAAEDAASGAGVPVHDDDSGDEDLDPGPLERDEPLLAWLGFHTHDDYGDAVSELAGSLVRATEKRSGLLAARDIAVAIDTAVLLSVLAPELVREFERVVFVRAAMRGGFAIARCGGTLVLIRAPHGAFGDYELVRGDVLAAVPAALARVVTEALAQPACKVVFDDPIVREIVAPRSEPLRPLPKPPPPPPPPAQPAERFVRHPTFGRGRVIEQRDDKLVIEFESAGKKTLLARFVVADQGLPGQGL